MARVVQRRSNPPYLAVIFAIIAVIALAWGFISYTKLSDARDQLSQATRVRDDLARPGEISSNPDLQRMRTAAATTSVFRQMTERQNSLVQEITGTTGTPETAAEQAKSVREAVDSLVAEIDQARQSLPTGQQPPQLGISTGAGLAGMVQSLTDALDTLLEENATLRGKVAAQDTRIAELQAQSQAAQQEIANVVTTQGQARAQTQQQLDATQQTFDTAVQNMRTDLQGRLDEANRRLADTAQQLAEAQRLVREREQRISQLQNELKGWTPQGPGATAALRPDGRVLRTLSGTNVVYISLGRNDRVLIGQPFAVYDARTGIPDSGESKAKLVVTNVFDTTAEARIVEGEVASPVVENDLIANPVYDPARQYVFVVEGEFDLNGDGTPDRDSAQRVRDMVQRFGGRLADSVNVNTDFVVLGEPPTQAEAPAPVTGDPSLLQDARPATIQRYQEVQTAAANLQIPVLNANRFLTLMGYMPERVEATSQR